MPKTNAIRILPKDGSVLNWVVDELFDTHSDLPSRASKLELTEGAASLVGSGEAAVVAIEIVFENPSEKDLDIIRELIALGQTHADKLEVVVTEG